MLFINTIRIEPDNCCSLIDVHIIKERVLLILQLILWSVCLEMFACFYVGRLRVLLRRVCSVCCNWLVLGCKSPYARQTPYRQRGLTVLPAAGFTSLSNVSTQLRLHN